MVFKSDNFGQDNRFVPTAQKVVAGCWFPIKYFMPLALFNAEGMIGL